VSKRLTLLIILLSGCDGGMTPREVEVRVDRLVDGPIISPATDNSIGENIQGPSLIRVPAWVENPLGAYYLYFADHKGAYIRLAYADDLTGPWRVYRPGSLSLEQSHFPVGPPEVPADGRRRVEERYRAAGIDIASLPHDPMVDLTTPHIASPDVHVDDSAQRIVMYFHGLERFGEQASRVATSADGIHFTASPEVLGGTYLRGFRYGEYTYVLAMPGQLYRSRSGVDGFEKGPLLFSRDMRHSAVLVMGNELFVFWTRVGDAPERILLSRVDLTPSWLEWQEGEALEVLRPEFAWEGADAPLAPSVRSVAYGKVNQLRDPAIFNEDGRTYLLYAVAGESGIAIAELRFVDPALTLP
jgi:hypothetical protein